MQKTGGNDERSIRPTRARHTIVRTVHRAAQPPADSVLERRLLSELTRCSRDVPESAFPSFLESLHYDTLN